MENRDPQKLMKENEMLRARVAELERGAGCIGTSGPRLSEEVLYTLLKETSSVSGEMFLRSLVRHLASVLGFRYVFVGGLTDDKTRIRSLAFWSEGSFASDFEYSLGDTPCENVVGKTLCAYPKEVQAQFPKDTLLAEMGVESYIGVPLSSASGEPLGILVALNDRPMGDIESLKEIFLLFGGRAALELDRKRAEEKRKKSMDMLEAIIDNSSAAIFMKDKDGRFVLVNNWYERMFGLKKKDMIGKTDHDIFSTEVGEDFRDNDNIVVESGKSFEFEENLMMPNGETHTFITMKFPIPGLPGHVCGIATDITERKFMEEELKKSEERLKEAQHIAKLGNWEWDIVNNTLYWSDEIYRMFGLKPREFGATYEAFLAAVHPGDRDFVQRSVRDALFERKPYDIEHRIVLPDGSERVVNERAEMHYDGNGAPVRMAGTVQDITERKKAEEKLRESEKKFRELMEHIPVGVSVIDEDGVILEANQALWKTFGYDSKEEFLKLKAVALYRDSYDREKVVELIRQDKARDIEVRLRKKNGSEFLGLLTSIVAEDDGSGKKRFIGILQDISDRKRVEQEILKAQKLDSIGVLAGGIAHDFNNLLLGILGNVSVAKNYLSPGDKAFELLGEIEKSALRTKGLTRQLLTFSKGGEPIKEAVSLEELVRDTAGLVLRNSGIDCSYTFPEGLWQAEIDEGQISQVFNNIILNARQAMPDGGAIKIGAENVTVREGDPVPLKAGDYVKVMVRDYGIGIPVKVLHKIFDPFFTTKQKASGLGLAVSYSIIKKHRGYICAESRVGKGSVFYVYLPAAERAFKREAEEEIVQGRGKVLVMDDEELVRDVSGEMLNLLGYSVEFASNGNEAVKIFKSAMDGGEPFEAVILDLTIPGGMGGRETVMKLREIDPSIKAIVSSGYSKDPIMSDFKKYGFDGVIAKPYRVAEFSKAVNEIIKGRS